MIVSTISWKDKPHYGGRYQETMEKKKKNNGSHPELNRQPQASRLYKWIHNMSPKPLRYQWLTIVQNNNAGQQGNKKRNCLVGWWGVGWVSDLNVLWLSFPLQPYTRFGASPCSVPAHQHPLEKGLVPRSRNEAGCQITYISINTSQFSLIPIIFLYLRYCPMWLYFFGAWKLHKW